MLNKNVYSVKNKEKQFYLYHLEIVQIYKLFALIQIQHLLELIIIMTVIIQEVVNKVQFALNMIILIIKEDFKI